MSRFRGRGFGRGQTREEQTKGPGPSTELFVASQDCGKIIGKGGSRIRELQESTQARIKVGRDNEPDGTRKVEISGSAGAVEEARRLIEDLVGLGDGYSSNNTATNGSRRQEDSYNDRHFNKHKDNFGRGQHSDNFDDCDFNSTPVASNRVQTYEEEEDWGSDTVNTAPPTQYNQYSQARSAFPGTAVTKDGDWFDGSGPKTQAAPAPTQDYDDSGWDDGDDSWNDNSSQQTTWTNSNRGSGSRDSCNQWGKQGHFARDCPQSNSQGQRSGTCHKCSQEGHFARDCPQSGGTSRGGGGACHKCGEEGHFARDCTQSGGSSRGGGGTCHKCGEEGHFARDCTQSGGSSRGGGGTCHKCGEEGHFARDCTQSGSGGGSRAVTCHKCGEEGHFARDCSRQQSSRGGFGSRSTGSNSSDWRRDPNEDSQSRQSGFGSRSSESTGSGLSDVVYVPSDQVGRIIGRGGEKIKEIQEESNCRVKVSRDEGDYGEVEVTLTGSKDTILKAKSLIHKCGVSFSGGEIEEEAKEDYSVKPVRIDWNKLRDNMEEMEKKRFADCPAIEKEFYIEEHHIRQMHPEDVKQYRLSYNNIMVDNPDCRDVNIPNPVVTFEDSFKHYPLILEQIKKQGFKQPSPVQCQAWPILMSGLDMIGIAQTGTGKTLAFLLPALIHIDGQPVPRPQRTGPTMLVLCPTRELALQIQNEVEKINYKGIKSVCVYGGGNRRQQVNVVRNGVEIIVATPGRLNDLIMSEIIDVKTVTYLVLDEADRMLDMGFEPDIRKVLLDIRPDRQTVMTSATWPMDVQRLADRYMTKPIHVHVGTLDLAAVHSVKQEVMFMADEEKKDYLFDFLASMQPTDKVIIFVGKKVKADDISSDLALEGVMCQCIHGDREQCDRIQALEEFRSGVVRILVATDVASRGLDVKDITHVLNYDFPRNIEEYVHRVGRTGRAGRTGTAITYLTRGDWSSAQKLIDIMAEANQEIPDELLEMAERFKARQERDEREGRRGGGRGFRGGGGGGGGRGRFGGGGGGGFGGGGGSGFGGGGDALRARFGGRRRGRDADDEFDGFVF